MLFTPRGELSEFRRRYRWMRLFVVLTFLVLIGRLVQLQLFQGNALSKQSLANVIRSVPIPSIRGRIFDNKGRVVATNTPSYSVFAIPHYFDVGVGLDRLGAILGYDEDQKIKVKVKIAELLANPKDVRRFQQVAIAEGITQEQVSAIKTYEDELPGVDVIDIPSRYYPYGSLASHLVGYMNEVSQTDMDKNSGVVEDKYRLGDRIGRTGLEKAMEFDLRGVRGWQKIMVDARGLPLPANKAGEFLPKMNAKEPRAGNDVILTVDMALEKIVEQALRGHPSGAAVVMDVHSGRVLAALSKPAFDPNLITKGLTFEEHQALEDSTFRPRIDKCVYENYFPGSIFKPFSAIAALEENKITSEDVFHCSGFHEFGRRTFRCPKPHGDLTLREGLVVSCNVLFFNLAEMTGMDTIARYAKEFGLGSPTGVGYNSEASGFIPTKQWYADKFPGQFRIGFTLNTAIGQGNVKTTLMQIASAYSAIANGGTLYRPRIVQRIETSKGDLVKDFNTEIVRRVAVSKRSLDLIMSGLMGVVEEKEGTAYSARSDKIRVAGKTGTAQVVRRSREPGDDLAKFYYLNRDHAWFTAIAPADNPEIVVVVLVEHGGAGGEHAAPVGIEIARRYFEEIAPREEAPLIAEKAPKTKKRTPLTVDDTGVTTASTHSR